MLRTYHAETHRLVPRQKIQLWTGMPNTCILPRESPENPLICLANRDLLARCDPAGAFGGQNGGADMRSAVALLAIFALTQTALAESKDCKTIADPALRLTCYDKINPPIATYPIPLPRPSHFIPLTRPDGTPGYAGPVSGDEDAPVSAKMNGICRGC